MAQQAILVAVLTRLQTACVVDSGFQFHSHSFGTIINFLRINYLRRQSHPYCLNQAKTFGLSLLIFSLVGA